VGDEAIIKDSKKNDVKPKNIKYAINVLNMVSAMDIRRSFLLPANNKHPFKIIYGKIIASSIINPDTKILTNNCRSSLKPMVLLLK